MSEDVYRSASAQDASGGVGVELARRTSAGKILLRRWGGSWIDLLVVATIFFVPGMLTRGHGVAVYTGLIAALAYFPVMEAKWGRTLGKMATGTIVVDCDGGRPGVWQVVIRTLFRLFEVNPLVMGGLPAGITLLCTATRQRLGDMAAGTYVVLFEDVRRLQLREAGVNASAFD